ncbi:trypsin-like serine protease [Shewanella sp. 10N.286.51.B2]|uniref:trypsin-like serine protease n=1 Tax=Shewanella sp. 10N.286.51.B2 TaxID=3229707 RepID=UPI00354C1F56
MRIFLFISLFILSFSSSAIVVRHDVDDKKYQAMPSDFAPLATFYVDGAHGTLIKPDWIVTAAHATFCVTPESYVAFNNGLHKVESVFVHRDYKPGKSHDIALVKLINPVTGIEPATVYGNTDELGKPTWFIGVGGTGNGLIGQTVDNYENNGVLRKAQNIITMADGPLLKFVFDSGDSALPLEGVSGGGDSGGPAFLKSNGTNYLLGVSSRVEGEGIGKYGVQEVYSRASYFKPWIDKVTSGDKAVQLQLTRPKLEKLPSGLTDEILPEVCSDIGIKPNAI